MCAFATFSLQVRATPYTHTMYPHHVPTVSHTWSILWCTRMAALLHPCFRYFDFVKIHCYLLYWRLTNFHVRDFIYYSAFFSLRSSFLHLHQHLPQNVLWFVKTAPTSSWWHALSIFSLIPQMYGVKRILVSVPALSVWVVAVVGVLSAGLCWW